MKISFLLIAVLPFSFFLHAQTNEDSVYSKVDSVAHYPGGQRAWTSFLIHNLIYPRKAQDKGIQGTVEIQFIVEKNGRLTHIEAISGPKELQEEGIRMIKLSARWEPGLINNMPVRSYKRQPFLFNISVRQ